MLKLPFRKGGGGTEWIGIESPLQMLSLTGEINLAIKKYSIPKAMAEGDDNDRTMIDDGNLRLHLQELLLHLLD